MTTSDMIGLFIFGLYGFYLLVSIAWNKRKYTIWQQEQDAKLQEYMKHGLSEGNSNE